MRLLLATLLSVAALAAQTDGVISGTVRNAISRVPLEDAEVSLNGESVTTQTDALGAFRFAGLTDGSYTLVVGKPGYSAAPPLKLDAHSKPVTVDLYPLAQIEGRVLDEDGEPVAGVQVDLTLLQSRKGLPWMQGVASEKDGRFLVENVRPGDYLVRLSLPPALRDAGYPAIEYYPGVADVVRAAGISVAEGAQMTAFDIKLRRVPLTTFKGRVVDLGKSESARVVEVAIDCEPSPIGSSFERHKVDGDGRFHIDSVPAGHHLFLVYRGTGSDDLPYSVEVDVGKDEATVPVPPWVNLEGIVESTAEGPWEGMLGIGLAREGAWRRNVLPGEDGRFTLPAVPPGTWTLRVQSNDLHIGARSLRVAAAHFGAASVIDKPLTVTESGNPQIEVILSDQRGRIAGTVEEGEPKDSHVIVFVQRLGGAAAVNDSTETKPDGSFLFADLLPGDYWISAWVFTESRQSVKGSDCTNGVAKVTVVNDRTATVRLKRCNQ